MRVGVGRATGFGGVPPRYARRRAGARGPAEVGGGPDRAVGRAVHADADVLEAGREDVVAVLLRVHPRDVQRAGGHARAAHGDVLADVVERAEQRSDVAVVQVVEPPIVLLQFGGVRGERRVPGERREAAGAALVVEAAEEVGRRGADLGRGVRGAHFGPLEAGESA